MQATQQTVGGHGNGGIGCHTSDAVSASKHLGAAAVASSRGFCKGGFALPGVRAVVAASTLAFDWMG